MKITAPGYYDLPLAAYLADPCPAPALSSSIVNCLYKHTPKRAYLEHPRLGGIGGDFSPRADKGSAVHALVHGGAKLVYVDQVAKRSGKDKGVMFEPSDWKTDDAKEAAAEIRAAGGIPLLPRDRKGIEAAGAAAREVLAQLGPGKHEQTMAWQQDDVWCRGRTDWISTGPVILLDWEIEAVNGLDLDTKTVEIADEVAWIKSNADEMAAQIGLRYLGHLALTGKKLDMGWLLQEIEPPYDNCIVLATAELIDFGVRRVRHAARIWRKCVGLPAAQWPGKKRKAVRADMPAWVAWEMLARGLE